jgi:hypothetical protein
MISLSPKTGNEQLQYDNTDIGHELKEFWVWAYSDILSNANRGILAEFIVGSAIGLKPSEIRTEWDTYDLQTSSGIKIEVKSSSYIQTWKQKTLSKIIFSIQPTRAYNADEQRHDNEAIRHADVYVFCHLKHKNHETINPLELTQWDFYVVSTELLNRYNSTQKTISLNALKTLSNPISYINLATEIESAKLST